MKILVYNSGGGLGDSIQLFDLITSLKEKYGQNNIFYLSAHENHFNNALIDYNVHINDFKTEISYFGLLEEYIGKGIGGYALSEAIRKSFEKKIESSKPIFYWSSIYETNPHGVKNDQKNYLNNLLLVKTK